MRDPHALGSCGCVDYHYADCPTRGSATYEPDPYDEYDEY